jgi:hypothetical protein
MKQVVGGIDGSVWYAFVDSYINGNLSSGGYFSPNDCVFLCVCVCKILYINYL